MRFKLQRDDSTLQPFGYGVGPIIGAKFGEDALHMAFDRIFHDLQLMKVLEIDPTYAAAHYHLSSCYELTGEYDLWLEEMEKGARLLDDPELPFVEATRREYPKSSHSGVLKRLAAFEGQTAKGIYIDPAWTQISIPCVPIPATPTS